MNKQLAKLFAQRFIARTDVKAVQADRAGGTLKAGDWFPDTRIKREGSPHLPTGFSMDHLLAHLEGTRTYGHYLLNPENEAKLFAFDLDLKKEGTWVQMPNWDKLPKGLDESAVDEWVMQETLVTNCNPLELWQTRTREALPARNWYKYQMKHLAHILLSKIVEIGLEGCAAYSGSKGVHVYGFTGRMPAKEVREAGLLVMDLLDEFEAVRGKNFYEHQNDDPIHGFKNFSIELFPKQDTLDGKNLGNLMRLPLGKNWKNPKDPTFFLDMTTGLADFSPHADPVKLLSGGNPFA